MDHEFYLVVPPGFEKLAERELKTLWPEAPSTLGVGGISVVCDLETGLKLNRHLKIPTRILLRVARFKVRDFPKLFKKVSSLEWKQWLKPGAVIDFKVSSEASRLFVKKRIEATCREAVEKSLAAKPMAKLGAGAPPAQEIFVRIFEDECTISLDSSGEPLYKRGVKTWVSEAPLRENLAAGLLWFLATGVTRGAARASYDVTDVDRASAPPLLIDPMMGSGTFLLEAASLFQPVTTRAFAFDSWTKSSPPTAEKAQAPATVAVESQETQASLTGFAKSPFQFASLKGFEVDGRAAEIARTNLAASGARIEIENRDFTTARRETAVTSSSHPEAGAVVSVSPAAQSWVILNPPYGERLKITGPLGRYYEKLFADLETAFKPDRVCCLIPEKAGPAKLKIPLAWQRNATLAFRNGGLPIRAVLFMRR